MGLKEEAALLAGRPIEVLRTTDGAYIVDYMRFDRPPPPKASTEEGALRAFIDYQTAYKASEAGKIEDALAD
jgi:hypothetical protein